MDPDFTAMLEDKLDEVAQGERQWVPVVQEFYEPLHARPRTRQHRGRAAQAGRDSPPTRSARKATRWSSRRAASGDSWRARSYPEHKETRPLPEELPQGAPEEHCSHGVLMQLRTGRYGPFYTSTHECGETKPFAQRVGVLCPVDGGEILEKRSKKGRIFYRLRQLARVRLGVVLSTADRAVPGVRRPAGGHGPGPRALPEARGRAAALRRRASQRRTAPARRRRRRPDADHGTTAKATSGRRPRRAVVARPRTATATHAHEERRPARKAHHATRIRQHAARGAKKA